MFGKRGATEETARARPERAGAPTAAPPEKTPTASAPKPQAAPVAPKPAAAPTPPPAPAAAKTSSAGTTPVAVDNRSDHYYQVKTMIFSALIDTIDLAQLGQLDVDSA